MIGECLTTRKFLVSVPSNSYGHMVSVQREMERDAINLKEAEHESRGGLEMIGAYSTTHSL